MSYPLNKSKFPDFATSITVDILNGDEDCYDEVDVEVGLECIAPSYSGHFDPIWGGEPPSGPEFDIMYVQRLDTREFLSWEEFENWVGRDTADDVFDLATDKAAMSGQF